jgi:hypothetical protein
MNLLISIRRIRIINLSNRITLSTEIIILRKVRKG